MKSKEKLYLLKKNKKVKNEKSNILKKKKRSKIKKKKNEKIVSLFYIIMIILLIFILSIILLKIPFKNTNNEFDKKLEFKDKELINQTLNDEIKDITIELIKEKIEEIEANKQKNNISLKLNENQNNIVNKNYNISNAISYFNSFQNKSLINNSKFTLFEKNKNPKVSIIIPYYNTEDYLIRVYINILEQSLKDIEIIFIDDCSPGNGTKIIENLQQNDKRIILLKNKRNRGTLFSRNKGAIIAKGEYIQFLDSDDLLTDYILEKAYIIGKKNNLDIIQYKMIYEKEKRGFDFRYEVEKDSIIYQPELSSIMYYGKGNLQQAIFFIVNRLIKREIFLQTLIYMGNDILNENLSFQEDAMELYCLLRVAKSLFIMKDIGYYYLRRKVYKPSFDNSANKKFHDNFLELKLIFNKTENNKHDKNICFAYFKMIERLYNSIAKYITKGYELFDEVFNLLLNCKHFDINSKNKFNILKNKMMINRKNITKNQNLTLINKNNLNN